MLTQCYTFDTVWFFEEKTRSLLYFDFVGLLQLSFLPDSCF